VEAGDADPRIAPVGSASSIGRVRLAAVLEIVRKGKSYR
jgi:hypothetical protein